MACPESQTLPSGPSLLRLPLLLFFPWKMPHSVGKGWDRLSPKAEWCIALLQSNDQVALRGTKHALEASKFLTKKWSKVKVMKGEKKLMQLLSNVLILWLTPLDWRRLRRTANLINHHWDQRDRTAAGGRLYHNGPFTERGLRSVTSHAPHPLKCKRTIFSITNIILTCLKFSHFLNYRLKNKVFSWLIVEMDKKANWIVMLLKRNWKLCRVSLSCQGLLRVAFPSGFR